MAKLTTLMMPFGRFLYQTSFWHFTGARNISEDDGEHSPRHDRGRVFHGWCPGQCWLSQRAWQAIAGGPSSHDKSRSQVELTKVQVSAFFFYSIVHTIIKDSIQPDMSKVKAIQEVKDPKDVRELRWFLSTVNYLGRFVPNIVDLLEPLNNLPHKEAGLWIMSKSKHSQRSKIFWCEHQRRFTLNSTAKLWCAVMLAAMV